MRSMSEQAQVRTSVRTAHTGKAPAIRKMKLRYPELNNCEIARRVGSDENNVRRVLRSFMGKIPEEDLKTFRENKAEIYDALQMRFLKSLSDEDIAKTSAYPRIVSAGILEDKARTIRGHLSWSPRTS